MRRSLGAGRPGRGILAFLFLVALPLSATAQDTRFDFGLTASGSISYAGGVNPLVATGIGVSNITALPSSSTQTCVGCVLSFTSGDLTGSTGTQWTFGAGGSITLTGSVPAAGASGTLLAGQLRSATVVVIGGSFRIVGADLALTTTNTDLSTFFGVPASINGSLNLSFMASGSPPSSFTSTTVLSGDLVTLACGNGMVDGSEVCDGTDDSACPGNCQNDCTCGAPPTDTPSGPTPTETPTDTPTLTPTSTAAIPSNGFDFGIVAPTTGTISYAGGANPLTASGIEVDNITPLPASSTHTCVGCVLSFTSGNLTGSTGTQWTFDAGGSFTLTGSVPDAGATGTLLAGQLRSASVVVLGGSLRIVGAELVVSTTNTDLSTFFGVAASGNGALNLSFSASGSPPSSFTSTTVFNGDLATQACGNGTVDGSEQCDGTDDSGCPGNCQSDCTCGAPPTDTPTGPIPTETPTDTPTLTPTSTAAIPSNGFDFGIVAPTTGTISYAGGANPLTASGIEVDNITPLPASSTHTCVGCVLGFTSGNLTGSTGTQWTFDAGGSFTLTGSVPDAGATGTLLAGQLRSASVVVLGGSLRIVGAELVVSTTNTDLSTFFGVAPSINSALNLSFMAAGSPPSSFTSTAVLSGDLITRACGNGMVDGSEQCDGTDDSACPGNCQSDCACPPPATDTPTETPTNTASPTATETTTLPSPTPSNSPPPMPTDTPTATPTALVATATSTATVTATATATSTPSVLCGDGNLDPGEQCDDGNLADGDGCESNCTFTPESASGTLSSNGTLTTDSENDGATPDDPIETSVTAPNGGTVTIDEDPLSIVPPAGFQFLTQQITISAPAATASQPLTLSFRIDASQIPIGSDPDAIEIFKDGVAVSGCTGGSGVADPDPCVSSHSVLGDGDLEITVLTSSASVWTFAVPTGCGNGIIEAGEQCDDRNQASGDGCSSTCQIEVAHLAPGGSSHSECTVEWLTNPDTAPGRDGLPGRLLTCTDDDPACDAGAAGDHACTFRVAVCLNVTEPRLTCTASNVGEVTFRKPAAKLRTNPDATNRTALEAALAARGGSLQGECTKPSSRRGQKCLSNPTCDTAPGSGDGVCQRTVRFVPPMNLPDRCTAFANIVVPLRKNGTAKGKRTLKIKVARAQSGSDSDTLTLTCLPPP